MAGAHTEKNFQYRKQDEQFVQWSKRLNDQRYDLRFLLEKLAARKKEVLRILDVGGGIGAVAKSITDNIETAHVDVIDLSPLARDNFLGANRTRFILDNFLTRDFETKYDAVIMRTLLHHLVDRNESDTRQSQALGLSRAKDLLAEDGAIFVTENFYEPMILEDATGRIIFELTSLKSIAALVFRLGANTAGEGVRFRSWRAWQKIFRSQGLKIVASTESEDWGRGMPIWQRLPLLCRHRFQAIVMLQ